MKNPSERSREILEQLIRLEAESKHFEMALSQNRMADERWPTDVEPPNRDEIRSLVQTDYLEIDKSAAPAWRFWTSAKARELVGDERALQRSEDLRDPDARLGVILD